MFAWSLRTACIPHASLHVSCCVLKQCSAQLSLPGNSSLDVFGSCRCTQSDSYGYTRQVERPGMYTHVFGKPNQQWGRNTNEKYNHRRCYWVSGCSSGLLCRLSLLRFNLSFGFVSLSNRNKCWKRLALENIIALLLLFAYVFYLRHTKRFVKTTFKRLFFKEITFAYVALPL